jgi:hypothetical protein
MPNRKHRDMKKYERYKSQDRKGKNRIRMLQKVVSQQPNNLQVKRLLSQTTSV